MKLCPPKRRAGNKRQGKSLIWLLEGDAIWRNVLSSYDREIVWTSNYIRTSSNF